MALAAWKVNCLVDFSYTVLSFGEHACSYTYASLLFVEAALKSDLLAIALHRKDVE